MIDHDEYASKEEVLATRGNRAMGLNKLSSDREAGNRLGIPKEYQAVRISASLLKSR